MIVRITNKMILSITINNITKLMITQCIRIRGVNNFVYLSYQKYSEECIRNIF